MSTEDIVPDEDAVIAEEKRKILRVKSRRVTMMAVAIMAIVLIMGFSFTIGSSSLTAQEAYEILINQLLAGIWPGVFGEFSANQIFIVMDLRAPRVLVAALIGAILAIGGCITQSIFKNPLATPYTLGVSAGASTGASLYYIFGISLVGGTAGLIGNAFIFSMIPVIAMLFALTRHNMSPTTLVLSGVAFSYVFSSINSLMQYFGDESAVTNVVFWTIGDLTSASMWMVPVLAVALMIYLIFGMYFGTDLDIMRMGDDTASSLGINVKLLSGAALIIACFMTSICVACAGPIGFVCLLVPHICRKLVGSELRWLIPMSACVGAILLLVADMIGKSVIAPIMLPVGAITALIGAPIMVYMLFSKKGLST